MDERIKYQIRQTYKARKYAYLHSPKGKAIRKFDPKRRLKRNTEIRRQAR